MANKGAARFHFLLVVNANKESLKINYALGLATSTFHLDVAENYRKNFFTAE